MEVYRISSWLFLLLGLLCLATTLQGVQGEAESEGPSESECRPYIEKALKELEISAEPITPGDSGGEETKEEGSEETEEEISTVEIITDDSDHVERDGDNEDEAEESRESTESAEIDEGEAASSKEEADHVQSEERIEEEDISSEQDKMTSQEETQEEEEEAQADATEEEESKEQEEDQIEAQNQDDSSRTAESAEEEEGEAEEISSVEDVKDGSDETDDKRESAEVQESADSAEEAPVADEEDKSGESVEDTQSAEDESKEDKSESEERGQESSEEQPESEEEKPEQPVADEPAAEYEQSREDDKSVEDEKSAEDDKSAEEQEGEQESADIKSAEESDLSVEKGDSSEDAESDVIDEGHATEAEGDDSKEGDGASTEEETKEDDGDGDHGADADQDSDSEVQKDDQSAEEAPVESETVTESESAKQEVQADAPVAEPSEEETQAEEEGGAMEALDETAAEDREGSDSEEQSESAPEEELINEGEIPDNLRPTEHITQLLKLDDENSATERITNGIAEITLRDLKKLYENAIKPLETLYKYRDLSNRHFGDSEIFSKPLVLFMGPWSGGKSSIINYLVENEYSETSLRTGAEPSPAYFNLLMYGEEPEVLDGTQLAADFTFSGLQKFGQGLEERLRGYKLPQKILEKINIVEIPGILEVRKQISRVFPFNDACQWFIDRADIIYLVYDPSKLDVGPETEAILDQLKGREHQTRIILNKADQVKPEELMRVQGALIWNISPLMSSAQPPIMYTTSLWSRPYEAWAPVRLLQAQERAFLRDLRGAIDKRIENKIASARRFAVRVRNHAKMVDCYLTTYYNHKSVFGNRKQVSDAIIEHPQDYHIYEGLSTLTNISRYDLPDPDVYRDFFRLNPLYDFQQLSATCTYFRGCPINRLDVAIAYDLPELVGKHKRMVEAALAEANLSQTPGS